ncbi:UNVERIFIED_CONTAM: hypothetical protein C7454_12918 [Acidovorax defluvii]
MVKISGYGKGGAHVKAHLMYISRHTMAGKEKVALENDKGQLLDAVDDVKQLFADWRGDIDAKSPPGQAPSRRDTMHMVLSMPGKADPLALRERPDGSGQCQYLRNGMNYNASLGRIVVHASI